MRRDGGHARDGLIHVVILATNLAAVGLIVVVGRPWDTPLFAPDLLCGQVLCVPPPPATVSPTIALHLIAIAVGAMAVTALEIVVARWLARSAAAVSDRSRRAGRAAAGANHD